MRITIIGSEQRPGVKEVKKELEKKGVEVVVWDLGKTKRIPEADKYLFFGLGSFKNPERIREEEEERLGLLKKIPKILEFNASPILTKVNKEHGNVYKTMADKLTKEGKHEKILSKVRKRRR